MVPAGKKCAAALKKRAERDMICAEKLCAARAAATREAAVMHQKHLHIHFAGRRCGVFDAVREMDAPVGLVCDFSQEQALEGREDADLVLANVQDLDVRQALELLCAMTGAGERVIALCLAEQAQALSEGLGALEDLWVCPMPEWEVHSRFLHWRKALETDWELACLRQELDRARTEGEQLRQIQGRLWKNLSREVRGPVNEICSISAHLLTGELSPTVRERTAAIHTAGHKLLGVLNDVSDYFQIESGAAEICPEPYEIVDMIHDVMRAMDFQASGGAVRLVTEIQNEIPRKLYGDAGRIRQILLSLLGNAAKFTAEGAIMLRMTCVQKGEEALLTVEVMDTGIGIRREDFDKLFDPFRQIRTQRGPAAAGAGLGLSTARLLVERMGGFIQVDSEYGKGSRFSFTIPQKILDAAPCEYSKSWQEVDAVSFTAPKARVMVVDNDKVHLQTAEELLERFGVSTELVGDGIDCLSRLWTCTDYDLILVALDMPEIGGIEAAKLIRAIGQAYTDELPIVAMCGSITEETEQEALDAGVNAFLAVPLKAKALGGILEQWLPSEKLVRT